MSSTTDPLDQANAVRPDTYAALDIETDGLDGTDNHLVAIGVGFQPVDGGPEVDVHTLSDTRGDERALIEVAVEWLDRRQPEVLATYNGTTFDLPFLEAKAAALGDEASFDLPGRHIDLFVDRKARADRAGEKWPSLEEALADYRLRPAKTLWYGEVLTNTRFAEELAPRYLHALDTMEFGLVHVLDHVIRDYTSADIHATMALYEADVSRSDSPANEP